jgi:hypothetical protein
MELPSYLSEAHIAVLSKKVKERKEDWSLDEGQDSSKPNSLFSLW